MRRRALVAMHEGCHWVASRFTDLADWLFDRARRYDDMDGINESTDGINESTSADEKPHDVPPA